MGKDLKGKELGVGVTQRKDGIYQARYTDRWGKRKTIYDSNLRNLRKELSIEVSKNQLFTSIRDEIKLDDWFGRWMELYKEKSVRPSTKKEYTYVYTKSISPYLGGRFINSLVKSDIQRVVDIAYENNYAYERQYTIRAILRDMLQRALEDDLLMKNPASGVKIRSEKEHRARSLSICEQEAFFDYCRTSFYDNLFHVAVNTGLRPGELFALNVSDVDFENGYINVNKTLVYQKYLTDTRKTFHIEPPKTKQSYRKVPINSECREYLEKQLKLKYICENKRPKEKNDYLFVTKFNTPINSQIYSDAIRSVVRQINVTRPIDNQMEFFSGHTFRHTFATRCFENGIEPKVVQSYLGHATLKMTMDLYTHVTDEKSKFDIEKIVPDSKSNSCKIVDFKRLVV